MIEKCIDVVSKFERIEVYRRFGRRFLLLLCNYSNRTSYVGDLLQRVDDVLCEDFIDECKLDLIDKYLNNVGYTKEEFDDKVRKEVMHYMVCGKRVLLKQSVDLVLSYLRRYMERLPYDVNVVDRMLLKEVRDMVPDVIEENVVKDSKLDRICLGRCVNSFFFPSRER